MTSDFLDKPSNYTLTFETDIDITSGSGCFIKYTFPQEVDLSGILPTFTGSGMLSTAAGELSDLTAVAHNLGVTEELVKWIAVEGCHFDTADMQ